MTENENEKNLFVGIDIRKDNTHCVATRSPGDVIEQGVLTVPSTLSFSSAGVQIGHAPDEIDTQHPLPDFESRTETNSNSQSSRRPLSVFIEHLLDELLAQTSNSQQTSISNIDHLTITVPALYTNAEKDIVRKAALKTGVRGATVLNRPLYSLFEGAGVSSPSGTSILVDVGKKDSDICVVREGSDGKREIVYRDSIPELGSDHFTEALLDHILATYGSDFDSDITCTQETASTLTASVEEALAVFIGEPENVKDAEATISEQLSDGIEFTDFPHNPSDFGDIQLEQTLTYADVTEALSEIITQLTTKLQQVAGSIYADISHLHVTTSDQLPAPIEQGIRDALSVDVVEIYDQPRFTARGAAREATAIHANASQLAGDVIEEDVAVEILGPEGKKRITIADAGQTAVGDVASFTLQTTRPDQRQGKFRVCSTNPTSGTSTEVCEYVIGNLPTRGSGAVEITVECTFLTQSITDTAIKLDVRLVEPVITSRSSLTPVIIRNPDESIDWFTLSDVDPDTLPSEATGPQSTVGIQDPVSPLVESVSNDIATILHAHRTKLWRRAKRSGTSLDPADIDALLSNLDSSLSSAGIEIIQPASGDEIDPSKHRAVEMRDSAYTEDEIVEVYSPGLEIDGRVVDVAEVVVGGG